MSREHYKPGVPSVTELLKANGYYSQFPDDPTGYYLKRGNFVNGCCDILAEGQWLHEDTIRFGFIEREKPLAVKEENKLERWIRYVHAYQVWMKSQPKFRFVGAQIYLYSEIEHCQGTLDQLIELEAGLALVELKAVAPGQGCQPSTPLQTAGYYVMMDDKPKLRIGLALRSDGTFKEERYTNYRDIHAFRLMVRWNNISKDYR
jgi:hypothetical protein